MQLKIQIQMQKQIQVQMFQFSLQYCQDTEAGPKQTWHSAEGIVQLEIVPSATVQLVPCTVRN